MNIANLLVVLFIAISFGGWPIIGKYSQASNSWVGAVVALSTGLVVVFLSSRQLTNPIPSAKAFALLGVAGAINGAALYCYISKTADPAIPTGIFIVTVAVVMIVFAPLLDWALNGSTPLPRHIAGFLCAAAAIYLLRK